MSRISEDKLILDKDSHIDLLEEYKEIIDRLIDKYDFITKDEYKNLEGLKNKLKREKMKDEKQN